MTADSRSMRLRGESGRGRRRKRGLPRPEAPTPATSESARDDRVPGLRPGWRVIAAKEFADHVLSVRFLVLTVVLGLAAAAAVYASAGGIREQAESATGAPSLFLYLFTLQPQGSQIPSFVYFIAFLAPLLGIAFGFDGINGERSEGTLPRLISQPIHRDDVVNGKFVAGLAAITIIFIAVTSIVAAIGVLQLGILPGPEDVVRLLIWIAMAVIYVGLWLALALLASVVFRRAATSALVAIAVWLLLTLFAALVVGLVAGIIAPVSTEATVDQQIANLTLQQNLARLSPNQLFTEATQAVLNPSIRTFDIVALIQVGSEQRAIPSILSLEQSLLVIWPQVVALIALTATAFAVAYVAFMRQEVRA
jgi:ABC-2 type transport system permease protein